MVQHQLVLLLSLVCPGLHKKVLQQKLGLWQALSELSICPADACWLLLLLLLCDEEGPSWQQRLRLWLQNRLQYELVVDLEWLCVRPVQPCG